MSHLIRIGVIMLNTQFPRPIGDIGNPQSLPYEVLIEKVASADVAGVVVEGQPQAKVQQALLEAAKRLERQGVEVIVSSCGFLGSMQQVFNQQLSVPIITSSLMLMPFLRAVYPSASLGVITFDANKLGPEHFNGHYDDKVFIQGIEPTGELYRVISQDLTQLDTAQAEQEVLAAAQALLARQPEIELLLLECTNLPPYRGVLQQQLALPVFDLISAIDWLVKARYGASP